MIQRIFRYSILYDARWDIVECNFFEANGITQITIGTGFYGRYTPSHLDGRYLA
jgi:hypothetical protein